MTPYGQAEMHSCLLKDVALAYLIVHGGETIQSYGFETPPGVVINQSQLGFGQYAFTSEDKRTASLQCLQTSLIISQAWPPAIGVGVGMRPLLSGICSMN